MDAFSNRRFPPADRFLGLFSSPPGDPTTASDGPGVELREDEVFWGGAELSPQSPSPAANHRGKAVSLRSLPGKSLGILAALPEKEAGNPGFLFRNPSPSPPASRVSSPPSSARMIPATPKPKHAGYSSVQHQSAPPVSVPVASGRRQGGSPAAKPDSDDYDDEDQMLPPHEIVARKGAPATTSSVLEGAGRTLKGRDLRRVRNAVWRQTGFLDIN